MVLLAGAAAVIAQGPPASPPATTPAQTPATPPATPRTTPPATPRSAAASVLENQTLFTVYGRAFGRAPILGILGTYKDFAAMDAGTRPFVKEIAAVNGGKKVVVGVHLIYGMAIPCTGRAAKGNCVQYLDSAYDLIKDYIEPAARRGWVVILDSQLARSNPVAEVRRMIDRGYLKYENVHVALDPEFHSYAGRDMPGIPIGTVKASQIDEVQAMLDDYVKTNKLANKKVLIVHQFGDAAMKDRVPVMITEKKTLGTYPNVELVIDMDGLGSPPVKVNKYNVITSAQRYPCVRFRGIKVFFRSAQEKHGHFDTPPMTMKEVFGAPIPGGRMRIGTKPDVVIIA